MSKQTKLLFEGWRRFLNEAEVGQETAQEKPSVQAAQELDTTLKEKDYVAFVNKLKELAGNPEFQKALNYGQKDGKPQDEVVALTNMSPAVTALKPTQNEIDMNGSLKFAVASVANLLNLLQDGEKSPGGNPIVTGADGTIVLDGHHRWSQVYCINPKATIKAVDLNIPGANPMDYLKVMQMAIASNLKKVPVQTVKGTNLLDPSLTKIQLKGWIASKTPPAVLTEVGTDASIGQNPSQINKIIVTKLKALGAKPVNKKGLLGFPDNFSGDQSAAEPEGQIQEKIQDFAKAKKEIGAHLLTQLIWQNVLQMRKTSAPVEGAPKRDFMPQTDDATDWKQIATSGQLNFKEPLAGISEARIKEIFFEELKKIKR